MDTEVQMLLKNAEAIVEADEGTSAALLLSAQDEVDRLRQVLRDQQAMQAGMNPTFSTFPHGTVASPNIDDHVCVSLAVNESASPMVRVVMFVASNAHDPAAARANSLIKSTVAALQNVAMSYNTACNQLVSLQADLRKAIGGATTDGTATATLVERLPHISTEQTLCNTSRPAGLLSPTSVATCSTTPGTTAAELLVSDSQSSANVLEAAKDFLVGAPHPLASHIFRSFLSRCVMQTGYVCGLLVNTVSAQSLH